jgi:hypothetical protein
MGKVDVSGLRIKDRMMLVRWSLAETGSEVRRLCGDAAVLHAEARHLCAHAEALRAEAGECRRRSAPPPLPRDTR